jgi:epoxyqueuosine reductase
VTEAVDFQPRTFSASSGDREAEWNATEGESSRSDAILASASQSLLLPSLEWLAALTEDEYKAAFRNSGMKRAKWRGLVRNACIALGNSRPVRGTPTAERICALLQRLATSPDQPISESALWAISRIQ